MHGERNTRRSYSSLAKKPPLLIPATILLVLLLGHIGCGGAGTADPQRDTAFSGPVEITAHASSATIDLVVSPDGASVTFVNITVNDLKTEALAIGTCTTGKSVDLPIHDGRFGGSVKGLGEIEGRFASATEAAGTVDLAVDIPFGGGTVDLGESSWSAVAGEPGSSVEDLLAPLEEAPPPVPSQP